MAKRSSEEYLASILNLLDDVIKENKKSAKKAGVSNVPSGALNTALSADAIKIADVGNSLNILSSAIEPLAKIKKSNVADIVDNIKSIAKAIQDFSLSNDQVKAFSNMVTAFVQLNDVFTKLTQNFFKTFMSFSRAKAWMLGRRMAAFYRILFKQFRKIAIWGLLDVFKPIPTSMKFMKKIAIFKYMINILTEIPTKDVVKIALMGVLWTEKTGRNIGGFFRSLIDELTKGKDGTKKAFAAATIAYAIGYMMKALTISLILVVALVAIAGIKQVAIGFGILAALVVGSYFIIKALSSKSFKKSAKEALLGVVAITMLIMTLTISLAILIAIAKKPVKQIIGGMLLLGAVVLFAFVMMKALSSNSFKRSSKQALWGVLAIILLFVGMTLAMLITIAVGKHAKDILFGGILVLVFTALSIVLFKMIAKINKSTIIRGLLGTAAIGLMIAGISGAMMVFGAFLKQIHEVTIADILLGIGLTTAMILGMWGLADALSFVAMDPFFWIGFGVVETIALMIASISGAMLLFTTFVEKVTKLTDEDFNNAFKRIGGNPGMVSCLRQIVDALADVSGKTMIKMAFIGNALKPVFESLSMFVDVIQKMAKMEILDHYDSNGKPVYRKMKNEEFTEAAVTVTNAFTYFLTTLSTGLEKISDADYLRKVIDALFPPQPGGFIGLFKSKKKGIGDIIPCISKFVDVIVKMASMTVPVEWNKDGVAIKYRRIENKEFVDAAIAVTDAFTYFVRELASGLTKIGELDSLKRIIEMLFPAPKKVRTGLFRSKMVEQPGIGSVIIAISGFMDILIKMANSLVPDEWDKDGNPIHYRKIEKEEWIQAAVTATDCFVTFLSGLSDGLANNVNPLGLIVMRLLSDAGIDKITEAVGNLMQPLIQMATGKVQVGDQVIDFDPTKLASGVEPIVDSLVKMLKLLKKNFNEGGWHDASVGADHAWTMSNNFSRAIAMIFSKDGKVAGGDSDGKDYMKLDEITIDKINMVNSTMDLLYSIKLKFNESGWKDASKGADSAWYMASDMSRAMAMLFSPDGVVKGGKSDGKTYLALNNLTDENFDKFKRALGITYGISQYLANHTFSVKKAENFADQMKYTAKGLKTITPFLKSAPDQLRDMAQALKELDLELVENEEKRTKAIQSVSSNIKDMTDNIQKLNNTLSQSMDLMNRYNRFKLFYGHSIMQKGAEAIVSATTQVKDTVSDAVGRAKEVLVNKSEDKKEEKRKENMQQFAQIVANAVAQSLDAWSKANKDLTIKFDESSRAVFGKVTAG